MTNRTGRWSGIVAGTLLLAGTVWAAKLNIVNHYSPRNRERPRRASSTYIILHTTEGPKTGSLNKVHRNGEAHYFVDRAGKVYRVISRHRVALHCGRSMWQGRKNIDNHAIGIEVVGYHNRALTSAQITALRELVSQLQAIYRVPDERVLTHSMVAYGAPNRWHRRSHRGRKRCGMVFANPSVRRRLGLTRQPRYDPDVRAGRLVVGDPALATYLYSRAAKAAPRAAPDTGKTSSSHKGVISKRRSAWDIAREKYNSAATRYTFPDGKQKRGNEIRNWKAIPAGTRVEITGTLRGNETEGVRELGVDGATAGDVAGDEYNHKSTIYLLPGGRVRHGNEMGSSEFARLPRKTRVLVGYINGGRVTAKRSAFDICGKSWNFPSTIYWFPDGTIKTGNALNESAIPRNTRLFYAD
jgi:hypothetical protein